MKQILFFLVFSVTAYSQNDPSPNECFTKVNVPAEYRTEVVTIETPAVFFSKPIMGTSTKEIITKEASREVYEKCVDKGIEVCNRLIPETKETVTVPIIIKYENVEVVPYSVKTITRQVLVRDGYVAILPCNKILK